MMYPVKKMYLAEQQRLENAGYEIFSTEFVEKALLQFLTDLGILYQADLRQANRKELMHAYVAGFQAILGVGVALQAKEDISQPNLQNAGKTRRQLFFDIYEKALTLKYTLSDQGFYSLFSSYLVLGNAMDINFDDITYVYEKEK